MSPLLFAAALTLSSPIQHPLDAPGATVILKDLPSTTGSFLPPTLLKDLNGNLHVADCKRAPIQTLGPTGAPVTKLGDLPPALEEHAVLRIVHGCPVREIVSNGGVYYLAAPTGGLERADPAAYTTKPLNEGH